ncbi:protein LURP-one-related 6-like isoform X2 [Cucurbita maxima]|uniref:Protein LURP-one-related 6-like isoform X2 n=1 Tax=Cucurbita maxima TaxID=3661 RepID=A0A6J1HWD9_CUCMA|nr:protein LURP-one-related 6-like isoform X2 [Cucurbita maxima]
MVPLVSKLYCSSTEVVYVVRKRPHVINGGGFVVTNCDQKVVFSVDGCGILGKAEELILRDERRNALLLIRGKGGIFEALSFNKIWNAYRYDFQGSKKLVFSLRKPKSCLPVDKDTGIRITTKPNLGKKDWDFEISGYFPGKESSIIDSQGNLVAQIGKNKKAGVLLSKDLYYVSIKPGIDQAFVVGVIAILDNIYGESTSC